MKIPVGTRSILYGAHCWFIHPWFVALAWWKLYGFPRDIKLWIAFIIHDWGYWAKPNMDGPEGEAHVEWAANRMHQWFDKKKPEIVRGHWEKAEDTDGEMVRIRWSIPDDEGRWLYVAHYPGTGWGHAAVEGMIRDWTKENKCPWEFHNSQGVKDYEEVWDTTWLDFCKYHSRFYAKRDGKQFSRLCVADKLALVLEPWWLYLPRVWLSGELWEYLALAGGKNGSKYGSEPKSKYVSMQLETGTIRGWHRAMTTYLRMWVKEHRFANEDTWTPEVNNVNHNNKNL